MIILYNLILIILFILLFPIILIALILQPKFRAGLAEKFGFYSFDKKGEKTTVFHAVSVGENNAIKDLVFRYKEKYPNENIIITTTTKTGQELANNLFKSVAAKIAYYPFDFFFSVNSFFNTFNPEKVIIAETEIWPGFVTIAKFRGIKVYTINGRISPHSYNGYKKIKCLLSCVLNKYERIMMQSESDKERMINIGAPAEKTTVTGNLKFDIYKNLSDDETEKYQYEMKTSGFRIFIAASTHKGEDEIVINAFKTLKEKAVDAKMLIAPRHPQRFNEVSALLDKSGFCWGKRSLNDNFEQKDIILLDTMGELSKLFSICHSAFIGGSFSATGGHNPLEAIIWEKPVISGNCTFNFKDVYKIVTDEKCAVIVNSPEELTNELCSFYSDNEKYNLFSSNAKNVFDKNRGAINKVLETVK